MDWVKMTDVFKANHIMSCRLLCVQLTIMLLSVCTLIIFLVNQFLHKMSKTHKNAQGDSF